MNVLSTAIKIIKKSHCVNGWKIIVYLFNRRLCSRDPNANLDECLKHNSGQNVKCHKTMHDNHLHWIYFLKRNLISFIGNNNRVFC
jgi:hypothetical protein